MKFDNFLNSFLRRLRGRGLKLNYSKGIIMILPHNYRGGIDGK